MRLGSVVLHGRLHFCAVGLWQESEDYLHFVRRWKIQSLLVELHERSGKCEVDPI